MRLNSATCNVITVLVVLLSMFADHVSHAYYTPGNILLMDHLNINHQKGRHDLVKSFYVDTLGLVLDPRKQENIDKGRKTLWTNAGITQFHLPEADNAQIFDGVVTLVYKDKASFDTVMSRLNDPAPLLRDGQSLFGWSVADAEADAGAGGKGSTAWVTDPWGSKFRLTVDPVAAIDVRGRQPGVVVGASVCAMSDLCVHVPQGTSLDGIRRFYEQIMEAPVLPSSNSGSSSTCDSVSVVVSPQQTLTFKHSPSPSTTLQRQEAELERDASGRIVANTGNRRATLSSYSFLLVWLHLM